MLGGLEQSYPLTLTSSEKDSSPDLSQAPKDEKKKRVLCVVECLVQCMVQCMVQWMVQWMVQSMVQCMVQSLVQCSV